METKTWNLYFKLYNVMYVAVTVVLVEKLCWNFIYTIIVYHFIFFGFHRKSALPYWHVYSNNNKVESVCFKIEKTNAHSF